MSGFCIHFDSKGKQYEINFQEQNSKTADSVLVGGRHYLLLGNSSQIQWLKEKIPQLSPASDTSLETLKSRITELETENFSFSMGLNVHTIVSEFSPANRTQHFLQLMQRAWIPGMSIAAISNGQPAWTEALGVVNVDSEEPVTNSTIFEAASLSKPLFAYIVLRLADRKEFDLDKPLYLYLPNPRLDHDSRYKLLTARMVLSHMTGLPNWGKEEEPLEFLFDPGKGFEYSGEGFVYLQKVIETVTGKPLDQLAREEVFVPLKMEHSRYAYKESEDVQTAVGYSETKHVQPKRIPHEGNAAGSLHTTARDYAQFLMAWLKDENMKEAFLPVVSVYDAKKNTKSGLPQDVGKEISWGRGIGVQEAKGRRIAFQWGDNGSFKSFVAIDPQTCSAIVYFTNSANGLAIGREIVAEVVGDMSKAFDWLNYERFDMPGYTDRHLGLAAVEKGDYDQAIVHFQNALKVNPDDKTSQYYNKLLPDLKRIADHPVIIPEKRYVGQYGPIRLASVNGKIQIYVENEKNGHVLIPLTENSFLFKENMWRIEIFTDGGEVNKISVHFPDGKEAILNR